MGRLVGDILLAKGAGAAVKVAVRSQTRRGGGYDDAQAESLWPHLKMEVPEVRERPVFANLADARVSVADYFDSYYHEQLHSGTG